MFGQINAEHEYDVIVARIDHLIDIEDPTEEEIAEMEYLATLVGDWEEEMGPIE